MENETDLYKQIAADQAVEFIESGMVVGLGAGSTAAFAIRRLAERIRAGQLTGILGIPCSDETGQMARELGIRLTTLEEHPTIDLTIDGADEVDPHLKPDQGRGRGAAQGKDRGPGQPARADRGGRGQARPGPGDALGGAGGGD